MSNSIAPGSSADVNVRVTTLTTNPNVPVTYKTIILKKNLVNGVNTLTQEMISAANTKYVIKYDFTLSEDITVPANCVLEFDGGSISGAYTITGNNTGVQSGLCKIFDVNLTFDGTWNIIESYPEWFGAKGDGVTIDTDAIQSCIDFSSQPSIRCITKFLNKKYLTNTLVLKTYSHIEGEGRSNTILQNVADTILIKVPKESTIVTCRHLTLVGYKNNDLGTGTGIYFEGTASPSGSNNEIPIYDTNTQPLNEYTYKQADFSQLIIIGFYDGINIRSYCYNVRIYHIYIRDCYNIGFIDASTDNTYEDFYIEHSGIFGLEILGANNRYTDFKIIWNGWNVDASGKSSENYFGAGIHITGDRNILENIECQDNYGNNIFLYDAVDNTFTNLLLDAVRKNTTNQLDSVHLAIGGGSVFNVFNGHCLNHTYRDHNRGYSVVRLTNALGTIYERNVFNIIDIATINKSLVKDNFLSTNKYSNYLKCNRSSSVTIDGITYESNVPVIVNGVGLKPQPGDAIYMEECDIYNSYTFVVDFVYKEGTSTIVERAWNGQINFEITVTDNSSLTFRCYLASSNTDGIVLPCTLIDGKKYRITQRLSPVGLYNNKVICTAYLSYYDDYDTVQYISGQTRIIDLNSFNYYYQQLFIRGSNCLSTIESIVFVPYIDEPIENILFVNKDISFLKKYATLFYDFKCFYHKIGQMRMNGNTPLWWNGTAWVDATGTPV